MSNCVKCGTVLSNDEVGIYKKMVNRGAIEYLCISCLSEQFKVSSADIQKMIEYFRAAGCTLFTEAGGHDGISGQ